MHKKAISLSSLMLLAAPLAITGNSVRSYMKAREETDPGYKAAMDSERVAAAEREAVTARKLPGRKYGPEEFARTMGRGYTEWLS
ncbi:MAG: hypothetical protein WC279_10425 [Sulfurimonas sp.]|jgi:hypothetical protein|uniref:hypothetical protein n=1 Tax=Sulfurimonas sp. TaxID=2022749 RepID=UPI00356AEB92